MHFKIPAAILLLAAVAIASPTQGTGAFGIDINGPMSEDFEPVPGSNGTFHFTADSKFAAWAKAQRAVSHSDKAKRQSALNQMLIAWDQSDCNGSGVFVQNPPEGQLFLTSEGEVSMQIVNFLQNTQAVLLFDGGCTGAFVGDLFNTGDTCKDTANYNCFGLFNLVS